MEITIATPRVPDENFNWVVGFLKMALQRHPDAQKYATQAGERCSVLRQGYPDDPAVWQISSVVAFIVNNHECMRFFLARAIVLGLQIEGARENLGGVMAGDPLWPDVETYLVTAGSLDGLIEHYKLVAKKHFAQNDLNLADMCCQRVSALKNPSMTQFNSIDVLCDEAKARRSAGTLFAQYDNTVERLQQYWGNFSVDDIETQIENFSQKPDRDQFAQIVVDVVQNAGEKDGVVFEVGCFVGYNLNKARDLMPDEMKKSTRFVGLEPNADVVAKARSLFPDIEFCVGDHADMIAGRAVVPEKMSVCTISRVLMVMLPEAVRELLQYLAPRTQTLVICDDVFNTEGEMPVVRTPPNNYLMHNFRDMLEDAGFKLEQVILADMPDRECTGFIVAKGLGE